MSRSLRGCLFFGPFIRHALVRAPLGVAHAGRPIKQASRLRSQLCISCSCVCPSKAHLSLRPQNYQRLIEAKCRTQRRRHEAERARAAGRGRRRRDGCEALEGCIRPQADRAVSGESMPRLTPDGRAVAGGAPTRRPHLGSALTERAGRRHSPHTDMQPHTPGTTHYTPRTIRTPHDACAQFTNP